MAFIDEYDFYLVKNEAEQIVFQELEHQLSSLDHEICLCNECVLDMATIALNAVKPFYRCSLLGAIYAVNALENEEYANSVQQSVEQAIKKISANPAHD